MSSGIIAVIVVVVILIAAALAAAAMTARRRRLREQFGPEYDRAVSEQNSKLRAEAELAGRQRRVRKLDIRPLSEAARIGYSADWLAVQERFVDSPQAAVADAYALVLTVMRDRGYPVDDDDQVLSDLSVEHARTIDEFRSAREISNKAATGAAATEDLRQAMIHYRALFTDLLGEPATTSTGTSTTSPADPAAGDTAATAAAPLGTAEDAPLGTAEDATAAGTTGPAGAYPAATYPSDEQSAPAGSGNAVVVTPAATSHDLGGTNGGNAR